MTTSRFSLFAVMSMLMVSLSSCGVLEGIFKTGLYVWGLIIVVVIAVVIWLVSKMSGGGGSNS